MIRDLLGRIFGDGADITAGDSAFDRAMSRSDELLEHMREASESTDAARAVMADIWHQHRNISFMTTIHEVVQEEKASIEQRPEDLQP